MFTSFLGAGGATCCSPALPDCFIALTSSAFFLHTPPCRLSCKEMRCWKDFCLRWLPPSQFLYRSEAPKLHCWIDCHCLRYLKHAHRKISCSRPLSVFRPRRAVCTWLSTEMPNQPSQFVSGLINHIASIKWIYLHLLILESTKWTAQRLSVFGRCNPWCACLFDGFHICLHKQSTLRPLSRIHILSNPNVFSPQQ